METGVWRHPHWYPGLTSHSSVAAFQRFLRELPPASRPATLDCYEPCESAAGREACKGKRCRVGYIMIDRGDRCTCRRGESLLTSSPLPPLYGSREPAEVGRSKEPGRHNTTTRDASDFVGGASHYSAEQRISSFDGFEDDSRRSAEDSEVNGRPALCSNGEPSTGQPHVVIIMADDLGYRDLGYMGSSLVQTPHIDALARDAVHLTNFFAPTWCAPSRAAFLTGRYPWDVGVTAAVMDAFPSSVKLLPELLKAAGYRTALVGKNHIIPDRKAHPTGDTGSANPSHWVQDMPQCSNFPRTAGEPAVGHGLDHFYGFYGGMTGYWTRPSWQVCTKIRPISQPNFIVPQCLRALTRVLQRNGEDLDEIGYTTDLITREAVRVIETHAEGSHREAPLFLWVSYTAPHRPLEADPAVLSRQLPSLHPKVPSPHTRVHTRSRRMAVSSPTPACVLSRMAQVRMYEYAD